MVKAPIANRIERAQSISENEFEEKLNRGERAGNPPMNRLELERLSWIVCKVQELLSRDFYMISFEELGFQLPNDADFIPKVLEVMENGRCVFNVVERENDKEPLYQGVLESFNLKRYQRLKSEMGNNWRWVAGKSYVLNVYGAPGGKINCTCGFEWDIQVPEDHDDNDDDVGIDTMEGLYHDCPDPEKLLFQGFISFPFPMAMQD